MINVNIIAAMDRNGLIGARNKLPWKIKEDLLHFRETTTGHPVVMGKKTWLSIGEPLDARINVVLTHDRSLRAEGCIIAHSVDQILSEFAGQEIFVIGGAKTFKQFLSYASKLYLTRIDGEFEGDTFFPEFNWQEWAIVCYEKKQSQTGFELAFEVWERVNPIFEYTD